MGYGLASGTGPGGVYSALLLFPICRNNKDFSFQNFASPGGGKFTLFTGKQEAYLKDSSFDGSFYMSKLISVKECP